ncbi:hypothetical protein N9439_00085 [Schleiferiaceae bacterium]|nr:hypothetical protein [Schleiferiaceae bacterium]
MKKLVAVVFVLITLVVMVLFSRAQDREQQLVNDRYKAACDFYFSGVVVDVANDFDVHRCMLRLELDTSTIANFNVRDTTAYYHAVIDGTDAEVIESIIYDHTASGRANFIKAGMRYTYDGQVDSAYLYIENELLESWPIHISTFELMDVARFHQIPMAEGKTAVPRKRGWWPRVR